MKTINNTVPLFSHQKEGIEFLKKTKKAILADEQGLGKTRQAIIAAAEESNGSMLVICPASLKINWKREIEAVYPEDQIVILDGSLETFNKKNAWYIVNYDRLQKEKMLQLMVESGEIETVIVDEAHYIKSTKTIRSKKTIEIVMRAKRVYCLTGTPIMNRPIELFGILKAIGHPLAATRTAFAKRYCGAFLKTMHLKSGRTIRFMEESGATNLPELREAIKGSFMRRKKDEVLDLPEKIVSVQIHEMTDEWQVVYDNAWDAYLEWVTNNPAGKDIENILSAQHLIELGKLKQVCSKAKIDQIVEDTLNAIEQGSKVIIFSQFTNTIMGIKEGLSGKTGVVTLTGGDSQEERQQVVDAFQASPLVQAFISNIKAGGVGINLTAASIVIFADMEWSPGMHSQAMDRAHRIGQTGTVNVYYYVAKGTIEEDIIAVLDQKREIIKNIIEGNEDSAQESIGAQFIKRLRERM